MGSYFKWTMWVAVCWLSLQAAPAAGEADRASYREVPWEELLPNDWHPEKALEGLDFANLPDDDPRALKAYEAFAAELAKAPVNEKMDGRRIKIAGFVAPLDWENDTRLKEFLLVPYFGACIHVPPPPANQIIYIKMEKSLKGVQTMDTIWVHGTIFLEKNESGSMGSSGYSMKVDKIEPYIER